MTTATTFTFCFTTLFSRVAPVRGILGCQWTPRQARRNPGWATYLRIEPLKQLEQEFAHPTIQQCRITERKWVKLETENNSSIISRTSIYTQHQPVPHIYATEIKGVLKIQAEKLNLFNHWKRVFRKREDQGAGFVSCKTVWYVFIFGEFHSITVCLFS